MESAVSFQQHRDEIPRSFLACLPWLWTRILFPGSSPASGAVRGSHLLLLIILPAAVLYPCLSFYLFEPDEGRYAQIPYEMLMRGDWIVPYLQSEPYLDKPPLFYWLVMISYSIFGVYDWSARLVPALAGHGCILLVYLLGRRRVGERLAFWGAMTLLLTPAFLGISRLLLLDGVLTFLVTLASFSLWEAVGGGVPSVRSSHPTFSWKWWLLSAAACGLGILCKGPVILILVVPPMVLHCALTKTRPHLTWKAIFAFGAVASLIALPWYVAICWRLPEFAYYFLWEHNVLRFFKPFDHLEPVWYYIPILLPCLLPASLLLFSFFRFLFTGESSTAAKRTPELGFLLLAGGWCVVFFSLSGSKLPTYILPAFPPLLLAFGIFIAESHWRYSVWTKSSAVTAYALMIVGHFVLAPIYAEYRSPMKHAEQVYDFCSDRTVPVVCYPRHVDSVSFYVGRNDFRSYRSKYTPQLLQYLRQQDRAVVLFGHRHSEEQLRNLLPPGLKMTRRSDMGLCSMAIVEKVASARNQ